MEWVPKRCNSDICQVTRSRMLTECPWGSWCQHDPNDPHHIWYPNYLCGNRWVSSTGIGLPFQRRIPGSQRPGTGSAWYCSFHLIPFDFTWFESIYKIGSRRIWSHILPIYNNDPHEFFLHGIGLDFARSKSIHQKTPTCLAIFLTIDMKLNIPPGTQRGLIHVDIWGPKGAEDARCQHLRGQAFYILG